ncbi:hypothetical protein [Rugosimonospora africana]|uniref:DUF998 domain-containing protein n=1 Tax=Rugosimonospora africana TaxID=556532 RepID=A0A8J3VVT7_9ACTN|nr:hypothetical protein [Rugosimonospora africana]GIH20038.1 hypothetical protein Raf01_82100 [Rugosimonospora africana]
MGYGTPDTQAPQRPSREELTAYGASRTGADATEADVNVQGRILYLKSYLLMRAAIGFLGLALPIVLFLGDAFWLSGSVKARGSLSAYYHSGMRDVFVGILFGTAVFLITYKVFEHQLDNVITTIAGIAVLGVALFPTSRPPDSTSPPTPLEIRLGEQHVAIVHYICAGTFIVLLGVMSLFFGIREGKRTRWHDGQRARMSPAFWRRFHLGCAAAIGLALLFIGATQATGWLSDYSLIIGETAAVFAFGSSWLMKGLELNILLIPRVTAAELPGPVVR